jgi:zinc/manganese transport system substrate-binding protein
MKTYLLLLSIISILFADKKPEIVTSIPDLADMARQIGGDAVSVVSLATGKEDLHAVPARPAFLTKLNKADLLLTLGLDAEHAWLPALAAEARNPEIRENGPGWIDCSRGVPVVDIPRQLDRSEGEQHPEGNPHYNIGPHCGIIMAAIIAKALTDAMPSESGRFDKNARAYNAQLTELTSRLKEQGKPLAGISVIDYHPDMAYLCAFYGMNIIGSMEPKAGIPPTASHLKELERRARESGVRLVMYNQAQNSRLPVKLAKSLGCSAVCIANAVGAQAQITSWTELQQYNLKQLLAGYSGGKK